MRGHILSTIGINRIETYNIIFIKESSGVGNIQVNSHALCIRQYGPGYKDEAIAETYKSAVMETCHRISRDHQSYKYCKVTLNNCSLRKTQHKPSRISRLPYYLYWCHIHCCQLRQKTITNFNNNKVIDSKHKHCMLSLSHSWYVRDKQRVTIDTSVHKSNRSSQRTR